jgi:hypothetical protein
VWIEKIKEKRTLSKPFDTAFGSGEELFAFSEHNPHQ